MVSTANVAKKGMASFAIGIRGNFIALSPLLLMVCLLGKSRYGVN